MVPSTPHLLKEYLYNRCINIPFYSGWAISCQEKSRPRKDIARIFCHGLGSKCSADLFCRSAAFPCHWGKSRGPTKQVRATPARPWGRGAGVYTFSPPTLENLYPRPLGGEGGPPPAFSSAGAGRVRGSKPNDLNPTPPVMQTPSSALFARTTPGPEEPNRGGLTARCIPRSSGARRVSHRSSLGSAVHVHRRRARPSGAAPDRKSQQGKVPPGAGVICCGTAILAVTVHGRDARATSQ